MNVIVVDDELLALEKIEKQLKGISEIIGVHVFYNTDEALAYLQKNEVDIAFLDIEMYGLNGLDLARQIKLMKPEIKIIFLTGYSQYALEAFKVKASGYLLKPISTEDLIEELRALNMPAKPEYCSHIRIQAFGNFEVFYDNKPLRFKRSKTKELLAYLVDRKGASITMGELIGVLWEDRENDNGTKSLLRNMISDLTHTLKEVHQEQIIVKSRNTLAIDMKKVDCDYFQFISGDVQAINRFYGEYMTNYGWAEFTTASLLN